MCRRKSKTELEIIIPSDTKIQQSAEFLIRHNTTTKTAMSNSTLKKKLTQPDLFDHCSNRPRGLVPLDFARLVE